MQKIILSQIDGTLRSLERIRSFILRSFKKDEIFSKDIYTLCFHALACFNFRSKTKQIKDREVIKNNCLRILIKLGIYNSDKEPHPVYGLGRSNPTLHFLHEVLGFQTTPYEAREAIKFYVIKDLAKIQKLVDWYETLPTVKKLLDQNERITSHDERIIVDFYSRCLEERAEITRYLVEGIDDRAIIKSQNQNLGSNHFTQNQFFERPYLLAFKYSDEYFDYRKINSSRHRIDGEVLISEYHSLQLLYNSNKALFYKRLKSFRSVEQIFESITSYYLLNLPEIATRKPVFDQIERLYRQSQWIALASLAITQVEGLFADMMKAMRKNPSGALPDKVDEISPFYHGSGSHFDYFKYILPITRNRFTHYGQLPDVNYKLLSLDLIYDINHLGSGLIALIGKEKLIDK